MTKVGERVVLAAACAHDDTACVRILTESGTKVPEGILVYHVRHPCIYFLKISVFCSTEAAATYSSCGKV